MPLRRLRDSQSRHTRQVVAVSSSPRRVAILRPLHCAAVVSRTCWPAAVGLLVLDLLSCVGPVRSVRGHTVFLPLTTTASSSSSRVLPGDARAVDHGSSGPVCWPRHIWDRLG